MLTWIVGFCSVFLLVAEWNLRVYRRFGGKPPAHFPFVSILVPARNEIRGIHSCIESLLGQDYPNFEVIVYDDDSDDGTGDVLREMAATSARLRCLKGGALAEGWTGKNLACHELSKQAKGDWFLFTDADTLHGKDMLKRAMETVVEREASFLSTFPRQRLAGFGDALLVPLMFFVVISYLPMYFVAKKTWKWVGDFSAACGQFMLVRKESYSAVGGHERIKSKISEAPAIASAIKSSGERILLLDGSPWVSCAMYRNLAEAFRGFSRSAFASMGGSFVNLFFFILVQTLIYVVPYITLVLSAAQRPPDYAVLIPSAAAVLMPLWVRFRIHRRIGMPVRTVFWHAVSILIYHGVLINSFFQYRLGQNTSWKKRSYAKPQC